MVHSRINGYESNLITTAFQYAQAQLIGGSPIETKSKTVSSQSELGGNIDLATATQSG